MSASGDDESVIKRASPPRPYVPPKAVLKVPQAALDLTLRALQPYLKARVEACCFWYGEADRDDGGEVKAVVVPRQFNHWGHYRVQGDAMARIAAATRSSRWCNLSQLHTHPGTLVEHSRYDDEHANSRRALSLVIPLYGAWKGRWPHGIGVHEFQIDYWHLLPAEDAARRVVLIDGQAVQLIDAR